MAGSERATLRSAYLYLVCLVTLVLALFAAVNLVRGVVDLAYPDPGYFGYEPALEKDSSTPEERAERQQLAADAQRRQAVLSLVGNGTMLLVAAPVYLYHWRRVQAEQRRDEARA